MQGCEGIGFLGGLEHGPESAGSVGYQRGAVLVHQGADTLARRGGGVGDHVVAAQNGKQYAGYQSGGGVGRKDAHERIVSGAQLQSAAQAHGGGQQHALGEGGAHGFVLCAAGEDDGSFLLRSGGCNPGVLHNLLRCAQAG